MKDLECYYLVDAKVLSHFNTFNTGEILIPDNFICFRKLSWIKILQVLKILKLGIKTRQNF